MFHASGNLDKVLGVQNILKIVQYESGLKHSTQLLGLYPDLVFWYGIGWYYFLGIFLTNTEGNLA
jgi:hypothetical protein